MTDEHPVEPSAIFAANGTRVPYRNGPPPPGAAGGVRFLLPALVRAAGPFLTTSALVVTRAAAATAAELAGRTGWQVARGTVEVRRGRRTVPGGPEVTWTHVELRWPR
ncbi:hypothetical protein [Geodermatophilus ruber]|uniref:Uncharacterized protein n=1 Tax=Geodermatophilus ruber TaxID=504800 RepID=A0A1I4IRE7_9ACTN|nr:hypothetical protein [Geodermatophilus ruber]SFL56421.1 hypothetical protein SAMN04488085_11382 [Geodermatophilus ruber]